MEGESEYEIGHTQGVLRKNMGSEMYVWNYKNIKGVGLHEMMWDFFMEKKI